MAAAPPHIVDTLIAERAPRLTASPLWPLVRPALYGALHYREARTLADAVASLGGAQALAHVSNLLKLDVHVRHLERLPVEGRCVVVCNHPTGIADGLAVRDAVARVRDDAVFFANADALRVAPRLGDAVIPVEWVEAKRTREKTRDTLVAARAAFEAERCVVLFPAGRLARTVGGVLTDPPWAPTAVSLARRHGAPIVPLRLSGPASRLFHLFDRLSRELRDITLFHEMLNKAGKRFDLTVGHPVAAEALGVDDRTATARLKAFVERELAADPEARP